MRQEIRELVEQIDAQVFVLDADMHMHAANQHPSRDPGEVFFQIAVPRFVGVVLILPVGKRMRRRGDRGQPVRIAMLLDRAAQMGQISARVRDRGANTCADLDLTLEEFRTDLVAQIGCAGLHDRLWCFDQIKRVEIDNKVFFFDTKCERRIFGGHACPRFLRARYPLSGLRRL